MTMKMKSAWLIMLVAIVAGLVLTTTSCSKKQPSQFPAVDSQGLEPASSSEIDEMDAVAQQRIREQELERIRQQEAAQKQETVRQQFVSQNIHFGFDDASLTTEARGVLMEKAAWLRANPGVIVTIEGHCDDRGTAEYNIALGQRRAQSIKTFLVNAGIDASRLRTVSFGEERPLDPGKTEEAYARNRRGQFEIEN
ncbi:MAG: peptidoglycan-associated lipoprotein Pal [Desulfobacteraceae bacterium]|jgi:peptidoglycan-associated lipoprotein|nr:MAG: peptidoglycan-associated lipoprotein Pal [Desulfobacteraceae bacterium]